LDKHLLHDRTLTEDGLYACTPGDSLLSEERGAQRRTPAPPAMGFVYPKQVTTGTRGPELSKTPHAGFQVVWSELS